MRENEVDFLPLRVTGMSAGGKRKFDVQGKRKLVDACLQPGASIAGLALKAGVNANQLHKWIRLRQQADTAAVMADAEATASSFVPVVTVSDTVSVRVDRERVPAPELPAQPATRARLSARLPNSVVLELECTVQDTALVRAMVEALGAR
jgi:transposase